MDTADDTHKPRQLSEMSGAVDWVRLEGLLTSAEPPNMILVGPAGIGKSCALRLILRSRIAMWLRCSRDPTLRDSRDRIKMTARRRVESGVVHWIVLEHADMLHSDAQAFLRRIIETSMGSCRFIMEVRDVSAIAEPLISRTILFTAPQLVPHEIRAEVQRRAPSVSLDAATEIALQSNGNVRWAVLQGLGGGEGMVDKDAVPTMESVHTWRDMLTAMEALQKTGSSPRAWARSTHSVWERPGGACPWAIIAHLIASQKGFE
jgi:replication-associated recombination protein RarA